MNNAHEKILIGGIQKFSIEDGPGIRTTVFVKGCPLKCRWCHNPELINPFQQLIKISNNCISCGHCIKICPRKAISFSHEQGICIDRNICDSCLKCADECFAEALRPVAKKMSVDEIIKIVEEDKDFYDSTGGGMTLSGGEILIYADFAEKLIDSAANKKIFTCIDTSGFGDANSLLRLAKKETVTNILFDVKSINDELHKEYTGVSNKLVIDNLKMLASNENLRKKLIIRMPLIKDINDDMNLIEQTAILFKNLNLESVDLLPYHNLGIGKQRNIGGTQIEFEKPSEEHLTEIADYFKNFAKMEVGILGKV